MNSRWIEPKEGGAQGKYRFKPGTLTTAEIKHYMGSEASTTKGPSPSESAFLIPHTVMKRVILEIGMERLNDCRFELLAYKILHFAGEHYLTKIYQDALMLATHMKKTIVTDKEMLLARRMCIECAGLTIYGVIRGHNPKTILSSWRQIHMQLVTNGHMNTKNGNPGLGKRGIGRLSCMPRVKVD